MTVAIGRSSAYPCCGCVEDRKIEKWGLFGTTFNPKVLLLLLKIHCENSLVCSQLGALCLYVTGQRNNHLANIPAEIDVIPLSVSFQTGTDKDICVFIPD